MEWKDLTGKTFGRLTAVSIFNGSRSKWNCDCTCGTKVIVFSSGLLSGNNKSCGCLRREATVARNTSHGMSKLSEYQNWKYMLKRCFNPAEKRYKDYAERGISVHPDFIKDFPAWFNEIGPKPDERTRWSVGRIDNNGWYTYGNMRWERDEEQARNHTLQANNTTGVCGVQVQTKTIAGRDYTSWIACWNDVYGKKKTKNFSTNKFGYEEAKQMAIDYRVMILKDLEQHGVVYADTHGVEK